LTHFRANVLRLEALHALGDLLIAPKGMVLLVKPPFEVGREAIGKKGVVREATAQVGAIAGVLTAAQTLGWQGEGLTFSPITGPAGNIEYLLWLQMGDDRAIIDLDIIKAVVNSAQAALR
jgi:23S rRNA (cytidine1920-2'-O)/16S rRNA (cytidine1409-2'-O)-methyltransferase